MSPLAVSVCPTLTGRLTTERGPSARRARPPDFTNKERRPRPRRNSGHTRRVPRRRRRVRASTLRAKWRKSSRSQNGSANCVEVADLRSHTAVRDSKNATGPALVFDRAAFVALLDRFHDVEH
ncbi:MAG TPA: DUF397 domain-containing protein [Actinokineospora sp.]|nr:DUF397 domain-containing protein [Actinokineospora sp.]